jgi:hypothetical protein
MMTSLGIDLRRIDWRAARFGRACCCPAKPAVIVVMPPQPNAGAPDRSAAVQPSRPGVQEGAGRVGCAILDLDGLPVADDAWPPVMT